MRLEEARPEIQDEIGRFAVELPGGPEPFVWLVVKDGMRMWARLSPNRIDGRLVIGESLEDEDE